MSTNEQISNNQKSKMSASQPGFWVAHWWKITAVILLVYTIVQGFLGKVPAQPILHETIRNLYFHVPMWFSMMFMMTVSVWYSIRFLGSSNDASSPSALDYTAKINPSTNNDIIAAQMAHVGMLVGALGLITGSIWARFTWGTWWTSDTKLNGAAITMLIYLAYFVLRGSIDEEQKRARVAAVYNIFSYVMLVVFLMILPRMNDSLHPGNGGNPGFNKYDLDSNMRMVFYPAVIGWIMFALWIANLKIRYEKLKRNQLMNQ